ncbi:hypothetical protein [Breoghania sp. L-A4]|uniref:lysozyme inhibitor LprI family protein n=1 Tax=Breoghania sp. L-A4 TaxID=2304600 RepID=UPI000E35D998|nr:hypothetical protein [Breoghania sp. L-A4]AXS39416.1 hypothetical protein D1F64_04355 [Breoghania sp. L-A4]
MKSLLLTVSVLLLSTGLSAAQSFNCRYAKLPAEVAICQDPELSDLDSRMAALYFSLPPRVRSYESRPQKAWLSRRNRCGYNARCIADAYDDRIYELRNY